MGLPLVHVMEEAVEAKYASAGLILFALNGSGDLVSSIIATVLNLIAFVAANNVKKQGK